MLFVVFFYFSGDLKSIVYRLCVFKEMKKKTQAKNFQNLYKKKQTQAFVSLIHISRGLTEEYFLECSFKYGHQQKCFVRIFPSVFPRALGLFYPANISCNPHLHIHARCSAVLVDLVFMRQKDGFILKLHRPHL